MAAKIGAKAPNLEVSSWVQGKPTNIDQEKGNVVLVEVFQVNCPGCFLYGIPEAIDLFRTLKNWSPQAKLSERPTARWRSMAS
jgi:hypothetical protein